MNILFTFNSLGGEGTVQRNVTKLLSNYYQITINLVTIRQQAGFTTSIEQMHTQANNATYKILIQDKLCMLPPRQTYVVSATTGYFVLSNN